MARLTSEVSSSILRKMGLISNSDNYYFEMALALYEQHGDIDEAVNKASSERNDEMDQESW